MFSHTLRSRYRITPAMQAMLLAVERAPFSCVRVDNLGGGTLKALVARGLLERGLPGKNSHVGIQMTAGSLGTLHPVAILTTAGWAVVDLLRRAEVKASGRPVAVCPECIAEAALCDEDRCCLTCGADLIVCADRMSADVLLDLLPYNVVAPCSP